MIEVHEIAISYTKTYNVSGSVFTRDDHTKVDEGRRTTLLWVGATYRAVAKRAKPSFRTNTRSGSHAVTTMYTRRSNLNPSMRNGWKNNNNNNTLTVFMGMICRKLRSGMAVYRY